MDAGERTDPYGVDRWGDGYVLEMENGDLGLLNPLQPDAEPVSLPSVVARLEERGAKEEQARLQAALDSLDPKHLELPAYEGRGPSQQQDRGQRRRRGGRGRQRGN